MDLLGEVKNEVKRRLSQIEVVLDEGVKNPKNEVLQRAAGFFAGHNDNYNVSWADAARMINDEKEDPSKPPLPGCNVQFVRWRTRRIIESIFFRLFTLLLLFVDFIIVIVDLALGHDSHYGLKVAEFVLCVYFMLEVITRLLVITPKAFFVHWYNILDVAVVFDAFVVSSVALFNKGAIEYFALFSLLRSFRIIHRIALIYMEKENLQTAARQLISENKRRYQQDGFDLDLTYVTNRVIATSFPSTGLWSLYRNPIEKVSAFLDAKHKDRYMMFNLCSEKTYDTSFFHGRVERVLIDDHNVPSLQQMLEFANKVREWLGQHPDNVIVVHCKGGKGRTGTMICVWLIESGVFSSAALSLDYFGNRRTDTNVSSKFQGVETPSQSRYVGYYERMKSNGRVLPEAIPLMLTQIQITGLMYCGRGDGSDFSVKVDQGRGNTVFSADFGNMLNCKPEYDAGIDLLTIQIVNCPVIRGDTRVLFQSSSQQVPKNYEKCPFYFWFHTAFVKDNSLILTREELDNPHKPKTWEVFRESLKVELRFDSVEEEGFRYSTNALSVTLKDVMIATIVA